VQKSAKKMIISIDKRTRHYNFKITMMGKMKSIWNQNIVEDHDLDET
jgi:hypothetical protein